MELQKLNYFLAAAQTQNFNRAAELCSVAQPVLSRQIASLEAELGIALFNRHKKRVSLTPAGREFADHVRTALFHLQTGQQAVAQVKAGESGVLTLGCVEPMATSFLPGPLTLFRQNYPGIKLQLNVRGPDEILKGVEQGNFDLGLVGLPSREARSSDLLIVRELYRDKLQLITAPTHPLVQRPDQTLSLEEVFQEPLILLKEGFGVRRVLEGVAAAQGLTLQPAVELDLIEGVKEFVKQGGGATFLISSVIRPEQQGQELVTVPVSDLNEEFTFAIVYRRIEPLSPAAAVLLNQLTSTQE